MTFVIAGGTGTVGSKITRELLAHGHQVRVLARDAERAAARLGRRDGLDTYSLLGRPARAARAYIAQTAPTLLQPAS
jgi:nucleoside-diphosphate-sugar epimerase